MLKRRIGLFLLVTLLFLFALPPTATSARYRFFLHGKVQFFGFGGTDCWGWTAPDGTEYALMGVRDGIAVVNAHTLQIKTIVPGPKLGCGYYWRDIETYRHYAYATSECVGTNQGLMVIDLQYLPDSVHFVGSFPLNNSGEVTAHTISIDTIKGFAYAEGDGGQLQPVRILSLANPEAPAFVGSFGPTTGQSIHDMYARNDTVFVAEGWNFSNQGSWSVWNCANKSSPALITRVFFPNAGYVHNIWPTENRQLAATTEEIPAGKTVKIWDISNLSNIQLRGQYLGTSQLAHNAYFKGNLMYVAHYEAGVTVVDISNPNFPVERAQYDTYPISESPNYNGCWAAYPYAANGFIYASNLDGGLFVLRYGLNNPPEITPPGLITAPEGDTTVVTLSATDADSGDVPDLRFITLPPWAFFSDSGGQGQLVLIPGYSDAQVGSFRLIASDGFDAETLSIVVKVTNTNRPPVLDAIPPQTMDAGQTLTLGFSASDPDGEALSFSAAGLKSYHTLIDSGNGNGSLTFSPPLFRNGTDTVKVIASDSGDSDTALAIVTINGQQTALKGDLNFDGFLNSPDIVLELNCIFLNEGGCFLEITDLNCDGLLTSADLVLLLNAAFLGDPLPC